MKIGIAATLRSDHDDASRPDDWQEEFDSPATVAAIAIAIASHGHTVSTYGDGRGFIEKLLADPPDLVFNIAEGHGIARSREARVPAVCEMLDIPYTGSDPLTLAVALDKDVARRLVMAAGVKTPRGTITQSDAAVAVQYPAIIKPAWEGSSKGIRGQCVVHNDDELQATVNRLTRDYQQPLVIEEYIAGDEITVGVVGNSPAEVLGIMRIVPKHANPEFVYSLEVKRDWRNQVSYEIPPVGYSKETIAAVNAAALVAYRALGCRDVARIDFRLRDGVPYFIEANPLPGLNPETGDIVLIANAAGVSHQELLGRILQAAVARSLSG